MRALIRKLKSLFGKKFEALFFKSYYSEPKLPPIFITGLPRSGTTLLYQYIVHRLEVSYFMNGTDRYFYIPVLNTWMRYKIHGQYISDFKNEYGKVPGPNAPHEAGNFWGNFFGYHDYIEYADLEKSDIKKIRWSVAGLEGIFGVRTFVNKNVKHLLRLKVLSEIFPRSYFIIIDRNIEDVALSLLRGRYKNLGSASNWWSARPPNWRSLDNLDPPIQIAKQLTSLKRKLADDLKSISLDRIFTVKYEEFCDSPEKFIAEISDICSINKRNTKVVNKFVRSENTAQTKEERSLIKNLKHDC